MDSVRLFLLLHPSQNKHGRLRGFIALMLTYVCPHCRESLAIPDRFAGQSGQCKKCGGAITVPRITPAPAPRRETPLPRRATDTPISTPIFQTPSAAPQGMSTARKIAYTLAVAAMAAFCILIFVQGVLPRAQTFSKGVNLAMPLLFLVLGVATLYVIGRLLRNHLSRPEPSPFPVSGCAAWLLWGDADNLECPYCGEEAHLAALLDLESLNLADTVPARSKEFTCGKCGAQFPFRYARHDTPHAAGNGAPLLEWAPRPSASKRSAIG